MNKKLFQNQKVTVMGLGLHGGGAATVAWLCRHGAKVTVTDLKTAKQLDASLAKLKGLKVKYVLGRHRESDFKQADFIVQNPGVPRESKYLVLAQRSGIPIYNDVTLFFKFCPASIIGVTGTRGKSTTSALIYKFLETTKCRAWLAGLPQKPMLEILDKIKKDDLVVLEISSWQLEILGNYQLSPKMAVITNIYPDHLNRYSGMAEYIKAKTNLVLWQTEADYSVLNRENEDAKKIGSKVTSQRFWFSKKYFKEENGIFVKNQMICQRLAGQERQLAKVSDIKLFGWHNLENVLAALGAVSGYGVGLKGIKSVLKNFSGLSGRLELVKIEKGIKYINDTTATTPDATMAALRLSKKKNVVLIAGGDTKNIPDYKYRDLAKIIRNNCKAVVLFPGAGSQQIIKQLKKIKFKPLVFDVGTMMDAVSLAQGFAKAGDTILLSPASASFNMFINEFDRGGQFKLIVGGA
ncbi:MAG: UDP-N-acetylmuramoyl-L-alanine--D-glutamate ligase [Patescibacteria group bacterium]|jgi:UDP-N-acetylmuramoylalanine--D-glutamate ligase|nr:UDP-N-acetylmuramoyl-L-alanine--D-glutamate ligase [Patescibacteria group bacterium]